MLEKFDLSRYALSKFHYNIDAYLYYLGADEETGESDFGGWYGLFAGPFEPSAEEIKEHDLTEDDVQYLSHMAGAILCENSQGFVSSVHFEDKDTLGLEWAKCNAPETCFHCGEELDDDGTCYECDAEEEGEEDESLEPEEGDLSSSNGTDWYQYGRCVLTIGIDDDRDEALQAFMDKEQFWPNCWSISDHGNAHLISFNKE